MIVNIYGLVKLFQSMPFIFDWNRFFLMAYICLDMQNIELPHSKDAYSIQVSPLSSFENVLSKSV